MILQRLKGTLNGAFHIKYIVVQYIFMVKYTVEVDILSEIFAYVTLVRHLYAVFCALR